MAKKRSRNPANNAKKQCCQQAEKAYSRTFSDFCRGIIQTLCHEITQASMRNDLQAVVINPLLSSFLSGKDPTGIDQCWIGIHDTFKLI